MRFVILNAVKNPILYKAGSLYRARDDLHTMHVNFSFKNLNPPEKRSVKAYFSTNPKLGKIQSIVNRLNPDATLEVRAEKFVKKSAYKVSLNLQNPLNLFVSEDDHTVQEAIDFAKDKLLERLRKVQAKKKYNIGGRNL